MTCASTESYGAAPHRVHETSLREDLVHRLRHDYMCGGICSTIKGDPFDSSQRFVVFVTTLTVSLMVRFM